MIYLIQLYKDYGHPEIAFFKNLELLGLGRHFVLKFFWGIWGIWTISTHFGTVSSLSMISIIQPLFLQKTKLLYPTPKYFFEFEFGPQRIWGVCSPWFIPWDTISQEKNTLGKTPHGLYNLKGLSLWHHWRSRCTYLLQAGYD